MNLTAEVVYLLCTATSLLCSILLFRAYRRTGTRLLMWSGICFACLCVNNVLLFLDIIVLGPRANLSVWRGIAALIGIALLCYGLIEEEA
jgi:drug/metabolite transporter (DMT)-like permease